jgi:Integrase core domain
MNELCTLIWCGLIGFFRSRTSLEAEILVLRHQLNVLRRKSPKRPTFGDIAAGLDFLRRGRRVRAMGIRDKPIACGSPWQNCFAERLIGSIRRECLDHFVILGEAHLRRILGAYAAYYNVSRTHRSLDKDAPFLRPVQRTGSIHSHAILGGLHHHYVRV